MKYFIISRLLYIMVTQILTLHCAVIPKESITVLLLVERALHPRPCVRCRGRGGCSLPCLAGWQSGRRGLTEPARMVVLAL